MRVEPTNESSGAPGIQSEFHGWASPRSTGAMFETSGTSASSLHEVRDLMSRRPLRQPSRILLTRNAR